MRLIDAEDSELQTQLKIIREAEYQIYGSGSWGFTAKCEHAIEDAPTVQSEPHWIPVTERLAEKTQLCLVTEKTVVGLETCTRCFNKRDDGGFWSGWGHTDVIAWMPLTEPYKGVTE